MYFQSLLLFGYLYAHGSSRFLRPRAQVVLHLALLAACMVVLPLALPGGWTPPESGNVIPWLVGVLSVSLGPPFLVLSATAPLLQRWIASIEPPVKNPYVLYAASNAGSFLGLLAFPLLLEPAFTLGEQSRLWTAGYVVALVAIAACGFLARRRFPLETVSWTEAAPAPLWIDRAKWVALAFVPSSLLLGVTTYLSTDVAATPLLWVIPLALYLLTFVIVFSNVGRAVTLPAALVHSALIIVLVLVFFWQESIGFKRGYALNLGAFAFTALVLHGALAESRPAPAHLTEFYLWMAFGGALGGAFTALLVPVIFESTRDYLMMLVVACFLRPRIRSGFLAEVPILGAASLTIVPALALFAVSKLHLTQANVLGISIFWAVSIVAAAIAFAMQSRPLRFGLAIAAIAVAGYTVQTSRATLFTDRSFFGIYRVARATGGVNVLYHGTTIHGAQFQDSARRLKPVTYYHPNGPVGDVFMKLRPQLPGNRFGIVGLGTGSILCYSRPGDEWTFFEIDPHVEAIARNPLLFTFMSECAVKPRIVLGDARLTLAREPWGSYSMLVLDAFSSDAIPVHLLTREAFALYERVLADKGILMVHISNRRLDLEPVVGRLAKDAGLVATIRNHDVPNERQNTEYDYGSDWVVLARERADLGPLVAEDQWRDVAVDSRRRTWTDDYSNLLSVIRW
jgi:hypothetical protein